MAGTTKKPAPKKTPVKKPVPKKTPPAKKSKAVAVSTPKKANAQLDPVGLFS